MRYRDLSGSIRRAGAGLLLAVAVLTVGSVMPKASSSADTPDFTPVAVAAKHMQLSLESGDWLAIGTDRHALAEIVAPYIGVETPELENAWAVADPRRQTVIYTALSQLGLPYITNGESPDSGFDCSGLTKYSWSKAGVELEHQSEAQLGEGEARTFDSAQPGDLLHYPGHIGLYLGAGRGIMHAVNHATGLSIGIASDHTRNVIAPLA